jgi:hypothetical protein
MESAATDHLWEAFPQDILTQIFKYLPIAPDRWNCLFVSRIESSINNESQTQNNERKLIIYGQKLSVDFY